MAGRTKQSDRDEGVVNAHCTQYARCVIEHVQIRCSCAEARRCANARQRIRESSMFHELTPNWYRRILTSPPMLKVQMDK